MDLKNYIRYIQSKMRKPGLYRPLHSLEEDNEALFKDDVFSLACELFYVRGKRIWDQVQRKFIQYIYIYIYIYIHILRENANIFNS